MVKYWTINSSIGLLSWPSCVSSLEFQAAPWQLPKCFCFYIFINTVLISLLQSGAVVWGKPRAKMAFGRNVVLAHPLISTFCTASKQFRSNFLLKEAKKIRKSRLKWGLQMISSEYANKKTDRHWHSPDHLSILSWLGVSMIRFCHNGIWTSSHSNVAQEVLLFSATSFQWNWDRPKIIQDIWHTTRRIWKSSIHRTYE